MAAAATARRRTDARALPAPAPGRPAERAAAPSRRSRASGAAAVGLALMPRSGGYDGARGDLPETRTWTPGLGSPDRDALPDLRALRARSRDMLRNAPIALGAAHTKVRNVIGPGIRPAPAIDRKWLKLTDAQADAWEAEAQSVVVKAHLGTPHCDLKGKHDFYGLQELAYRARFESGDVFGLRRYVARRGDVLACKVQLVEADRVSTPRDRASDPALRDGVELDAEGMPVACHVLNVHPGDPQAGLGAVLSPWTLTLPVGGAWTRVPYYGPESGERQVAHVAKLLRPDQTRGVPELAPVIIMLKQLGRYTDSELAAAVLTSFFTVFVKKAPGEGAFGEQGGAQAFGLDTATDEVARQVALGQGSVVELEDGESIETANPGRPNDRFDPFVMAILRQIGVALELPFELLVKHFQASYSASRAALLEAWRAFVAEQAWFVVDFCQPVYEWALAEAIARGLLRAPGFFDDPLARLAWSGCAWHGPTMGQINPQAEAAAIQGRLDAGVTSRTREAAALGYGSWEAIQRERAKEERQLRQDGVNLAGSASAPTTLGAPATPPNGHPNTAPNGAPAPTPADQADEDDA